MTAGREATDARAENLIFHMNSSKSGRPLLSFPESPTATATAKLSPIRAEGRATHQEKAMVADTEEESQPRLLSRSPALNSNPQPISKQTT